MTSLKSILKYFKVTRLTTDNKYPTAEEHNDKSKQEFLFACKRCGSISEPMNIKQDIKHRLSIHLVRYCRPSPGSEQEEQQQGPEPEQK